MCIIDSFSPGQGISLSRGKSNRGAASFQPSDLMPIKLSIIAGLPLPWSVTPPFRSSPCYPGLGLLFISPGERVFSIFSPQELGSLMVYGSLLIIGTTPSYLMVFPIRHQGDAPDKGYKVPTGSNGKIIINMEKNPIANVILRYNNNSIYFT